MGLKQTKPEAVSEDCEDDLFDGMSPEFRELFTCALDQVIEEEMRRLDEETKDIEVPPPSRRHKIRMNRLFRERVGSTKLPFPEVDNLCERIRSKLVVKFKINERRDRRKQRKLRR